MNNEEKQQLDSNELLLKTLEITKKYGIDDVIAQYHLGKEWQIRFSNSEQDIIKQWEVDNLELFIVKNKRTTMIPIQTPTLKKIEEKIKQSLIYLENSPPSQLYAGIESNIQTPAKIDGLFYKKTENLIESGSSLVYKAIDAALEEGAKKVAGVLYFGSQNSALRTSKGFSGEFDHSYYRATLRAFVEAQSSGQDLLCGRNLDNLEAKMITMGKNAGKIASMAVNPKQGKAGTYDIILSPTVAGNIFGEITDAANPLFVMLGLSPLKDKIGKQIGPNFLSIRDNNLLSEGLNARPFDVEGTPGQITPLIENGKLMNYVHNTSTAIQYSTKSTGNSVFIGFGTGTKLLAPYSSNIEYTPGDFSKNEIIEESKKPTIYITSNWYTRFTNQMEGTFSTIPRDGLFYVENGEIQYPIRNVRLSDNLLRMLKNITQIGKDIQQIQWWEVNTPTFIPTIKVKDGNITAATK
ncbi:TldD/PmbA family protein [Candidatus Harpocratesius sp.]